MMSYHYLLIPNFRNVKSQMENYFDINLGHLCSSVTSVANKLLYAQSLKKNNKRGNHMYMQVKTAFKAIFGSSGEIRTFFAPGRVNLIGEHTDYNGGYVLPCALTLGTYAVARKRSDSTVRLYSENFPELGIIELSLEDLDYNAAHFWGNYPKGVTSVLCEAGFVPDTGFEVVYGGNIPNGAGLSSSASIELVTAVMLRNLFGWELSMEALAAFARQAENTYIGVQCGIMDQFAIAMGHADHALLLNTDTLAFETVPLKLDNHRIVIANTNKRRGLADSQYNQRTVECGEALKAIQACRPVTFLCDLTAEEFSNCGNAIPDPVVWKRARHVILENARALLASDALKAGDIQEFGRLMNASHISLRDDYEVTGTELDTLVELAWNQSGVVGARMTGAGFGGCTVNLVETQAVDAFIEEVGKGYESRIGYPASFYVVEAGDGAREIVEVS